MKNNHKLKGLFLFVLAALPLFFLVLPADAFDNGHTICLSQRFFNTACYGCGITRALQHLIHLELEQALELNPLSPFVFALLIFVWCAEMRRLAPEFMRIHPIAPDLPQECIAITAQVFMSIQFHTTHDVPSYQAGGTRGRSLVDGADMVPIFGSSVPVRAEIHYLRGLSAHADREELLRWCRELPGVPERIFLNHGEDPARKALETAIREMGWPRPLLPLPGDVHPF